MVINNLCPACNQVHERDGLMPEHMIKYKVHPNKEGSDLIMVCTCSESPSIVDLGACSCGTRGFITPPEERIGIYTGTDYMIDLSGDRVTCSSCPKPKTCSHCGKQAHTGIGLYSLNGDSVHICNNCVNVYYRMCNACGNLMLNGDIPYCQKCLPKFRKCTSCGRWRTRDDVIEIDGHVGCSACIFTTRCSYCGELRPCIEVEGRNGIYLCGEHASFKHSIAIIGGYHHTKAVDFKKIKGQNTPLFFGIEWEFMARIYGNKFPANNVALRKAIMAKEVEKRFPDVELKRDGSLNVRYRNSSYDVGVEAVWQPMTFEYIKEQESLFYDMFANIKNYHTKMDTAAGMHVHMSKDAFTPLHFMKFLQFFYVVEKLPFSIFMAGRNSTGYAKRSSTFTGNGYSLGSTPKALTKNRYYHEGKKIARHKYTNFDRYEAVNITNKDTIEMRMFKAPQDALSFMSNIEYLHSVYMYTLNKALSKIGLEDYFEFVAKNAKVYSNLTKKIEAYKGSQSCA